MRWTRDWPLKGSGWGAALRLVGFLGMLLVPGWARSAVILQYHHISSSTPPSTSTTPARFAEHMQYLQDQGFAVVPLASLIDARQKGLALPDKTAAITFDDGYDSIYTTALPILKTYGWPFTVFVSTDPVDQHLRHFMSWDQIRELAANGATIANHTATHAHLIRREGQEFEADWSARIRSEIERAQQRIQAEVGEAPAWLAYPYGEYNRQLQALVAEMGYVGIAQISGPLSPLSPLTALPRFPFGGSYGDSQDFALKVSTLPMPLTAIELLDQSGEVITDVQLPAALTRPGLKLHLAKTDLTRQVQCYSNSKALPATRDANTLAVITPVSLGAGRSRFNCTAPAGAGRFYWYSQLFIRPQANGQWYHEP